MLRILFAITFVILFLLVSVLILPMMHLVGRINQTAKDRASLAIVNWAFRGVLFFAGTKAVVKGEENVPKDEAVLYILNHRSFFDIILTYVRVPRPTGFVAKKEMLNFLTLTWWMKNLHCEFMDRSDLRKGMQCINRCIDNINAGYSMAICPEGTRNKTEEPLLPFHKGSFKIAEKTGCKIVPVVLTNTSAIFEDHLPLLKKQTVTIEYLPAIDVAALDRDERRNLCSNVEAMVKETYLKNLER